MEEKKLAIREVYSQLDKEVSIEKNISFGEQFEVLVSYVDFLIQTDFNKLINILYRVDVSEEKLKIALQENNNTPISRVIATMLLKRELEKRKWRTLYKKKRKYE
ncbi:hypothetical protein CGC48_09895 [Capnocytophaga cynodegmi]|uniref:Uncharacterized protein n=1 Tax=Capnocytophaga cynodegmi TaxID=28189 RepID=A0A250E8Q3_9FLAO|nr:hypothetical protein CGC48_09895 [Capnocytophaga cynodegmi]